MTRTGVSRRIAVIAASAGMVLAAPTAAVALTTHSATATATITTEPVEATAKCGANEHVVSGGYTSPKGSVAIASHAVGGGRWTVHLFPGTVGTLTTFAYCTRNGRISQHEKQGTAVAAPANTVVAARCPSGAALVAGGYEYVSANSESDSPTYRDYATTTRTWGVMAAIAITPAELAVFAYCERGVVVNVRSGSSGSIPGMSGGSATASCDKGETLLAGGYTTNPLPDWNNTIGPDLFYSASYRSGVRSWTASAYNFSNVNSMTAGTITAFAYCEP